MLPGLLSRFRSHPAAPFAVLLISLSIAIPSSLAAPDVKIKRMIRSSGIGSVHAGPTLEEVTEYIQANRRRMESRTQDSAPLWPQGPLGIFYSPRIADIQRCEDGKQLRFNLDDHTYQEGFLGKLAKVLMPPVIPPPPSGAVPTHPTFLTETTTVDTGERKQVFGFTARHIKITMKQVSLDGVADQHANQTSETDGWYIDLNTRISCDPNFPAPREGSTYNVSGGAVFVAPGATNQAAPKWGLVETRYVGQPETGLCIWSKGVSRNAHFRNGVKEEFTQISEMQVMELTVRPLTPALFEVPGNFRAVDQIRYVPRVSWWSYFRYWDHYYWVRFRKALWLPAAR